MISVERRESHIASKALTVRLQLGIVRYSPTVITAAITSSRTKTWIPTHVPVGDVLGLYPDSTILLEQLRTLDKSRLLEYIGTVDQETMRQVDEAFRISVGHD